MARSKNQRKRRSKGSKGSSLAKAGAGAKSEIMSMSVSGKKHSKNQNLKNRMSSMQQMMKQRLQGGKFRMLNEQLYTNPGNDSFEKFQKEPELFDVYHEGFREQAAKWPSNPLDLMINYIKERPKKLIIADFGCGDAVLQASVPNKVHSFDLVSRKPEVTACDIADVPLSDNSVDIGVYCLSLMGTNVSGFIKECSRVLKPQGIVKIAEVKSRFENESLGGIKGFVSKMKAYGFDLKSKRENNKMFVMFDFVKTKKKTSSVDLPEIEFKPCEYKRR